MIFKCFFLFLCISSDIIAIAQPHRDSTFRRICVADVDVQSFRLTRNWQDGVFDDFKGLAPQSSLLTRDLTGYTSGPFAGLYGPTSNLDGGFIFPNTYYGGSENMVSVLIGIKIRNKEKSGWRVNPQFRVGVSYCSGMSVGVSMVKMETKPFDTLISSQTGQVTYIDSVNKSYFNLLHVSEQLGVNASFIYRTNQKFRWSVFGGIGVVAGTSITSYTFINYDIDRSTYTHANNSSSTSYGTSYFETEQFKNKHNTMFSVFTPAGIDFRVGKTSEFWKRFHLYYEFSSSVNIQNIPELRTVSWVGIKHGFGLRVLMN